MSAAKETQSQINRRLIDAIATGHTTTDPRFSVTLGTAGNKDQATTDAIPVRGHSGAVLRGHVVERRLGLREGTFNADEAKALYYVPGLMSAPEANARFKGLLKGEDTIAPGSVAEVMPAVESFGPKATAEALAGHALTYAEFSRKIAAKMLDDIDAGRDEHRAATSEGNANRALDAALDRALAPGGSRADYDALSRWLLPRVVNGRGADLMARLDIAQAFEDTVRGSEAPKKEVRQERRRILGRMPSPAIARRRLAAADALALPAEAEATAPAPGKDAPRVPLARALPAEAEATAPAPGKDAPRVPLARAQPAGAEATAPAPGKDAARATTQAGTTNRDIARALREDILGVGPFRSVSAPVGTPVRAPARTAPKNRFALPSFVDADVLLRAAEAAARGGPAPASRSRPKLLLN